MVTPVIEQRALKIEQSKTYDFSVLIILRTFDKFSLLAPIDKGGKSGNDKYSQVNSSSIKPS